MRRESEFPEQSREDSFVGSRGESDAAGKERERSDGSPWKIDQTA